MDILKELESLDFDTSIYTEKAVKNCNHNEKVALTGTLKVSSSKTKTGNPYFILTITDSTGSISCPAWNSSPLFNFIKEEDNGKKVKVYGIASIGKYNNIDIKQIQFIEETEEELNEGVPTDITIPNLRKELNDRVSSIISDFLRNVVTEALSIVDDDLENTPFTEKTAYNYRGGLIHEIIDSCNLVNAVVDSINCGFYAESTILNEDLLITGAILGNLGKTRTLTLENNIPVKTFEGQLDEDSIYSREIASIAIRKVMETLPDEEKDVYDKLSKELLHMIASIKGNSNFGALTTPRSKHAMILHQINDLVYTKGLFENLEKANENKEEFVKAYDNGKNYYLGSVEE